MSFRSISFRPRDGEQSLKNEILEFGGEFVSFPVFELKPCISGEDLFKKIQRKEEENLVLVFSSPSAVAIFHNLLSGRALGKMQFAAVGRRTAMALKKIGCHASVIAQQENAHGLARELCGGTVFADPHYLVMGSNKSRPELIQGLKSQNMRFEKLSFYSVNVFKPEGDYLRRFAEICSNSSRTVLMFSSPLMVETACEFAKASSRDICNKFFSFPVASIAPLTTRTALLHGFTQIKTAEQTSLSSLVTAARNIMGVSLSYHRFSC